MYRKNITRIRCHTNKASSWSPTWHLFISSSWTLTWHCFICKCLSLQRSTPWENIGSATSESSSSVDASHRYFFFYQHTSLLDGKANRHLIIFNEWHLSPNVTWKVSMQGFFLNVHYFISDSSVTLLPSLPDQYRGSGQGCVDCSLDSALSWLMARKKKNPYCTAAGG